MIAAKHSVFSYRQPAGVCPKSAHHLHLLIRSGYLSMLYKAIPESESDMICHRKIFFSGTASMPRPSYRCESSPVISSHVRPFSTISTIR